MTKDRDAIKDILLSKADIAVSLERYIEGVRAEAIGWAHADACAAMDKGEDPRNSDVPDMLVRARKDLV